MSEKITKFTNKVSPLIEGQVPDFVQSDHPIFVDFVKAKYQVSSGDILKDEDIAAELAEIDTDV